MKTLTPQQERLLTDCTQPFETEWCGATTWADIVELWRRGLVNITRPNADLADVTITPLGKAVLHYQHAIRALEPDR